jgi:hypothetical protein
MMIFGVFASGDYTTVLWRESDPATVKGWIFCETILYFLACWEISVSS